MLPFSGVKHICFAVDDIEAAEAVWVKLLGIKSTGITTLSLEGGGPKGHSGWLKGSNVQEGRGEGISAFFERRKPVFKNR